MMWIEDLMMQGNETLRTETTATHAMRFWLASTVIC